MKLDFTVKKQLGTFQLQAKGTFQEGITGLYGPSASGKSTLLKILSGVMSAEEGDIILNDERYFSSADHFNLPIEDRRIGMIWQETLLFPHLSVKENVHYGLRTDCPKSFYDKIWNILQIAPLENRMPKHLSGGEKQRVAMARVLLHQPMWLLLDEPLVAIDIATRERITAYLKTINQELKVPIVYVSHSVNDLMYLCDEVVMMEQGQLKRTGSPEDLFLSEDHLSEWDDDLENILELKTVQLNNLDQIIDLDLNGKILKAVYTKSTAPVALRIGIKAKDILIATTPIEGISARNKIYGVIEKIETADEKVLLACRIHSAKIWVEITAGSFRDLKLALGQGVYLIIKARSIRVMTA